MRADDIGFDKYIGAVNRTIHMRFSREVHQRIDSLFAQQGFDQRGIANIAFHKTQFRTISHTIEVGQIARIRECIQHHQAITRMLQQPVMHKV